MADLKLLRKIAISALIMIAAAVVQWLFWSHLNPLIFVLFYPAVVAAVLYAEPFSAIVFAAVLAQFFDSPDFSFHFNWQDDLPRHATFILFGVLIAIFGKKRTVALEALKTQRDKLAAVKVQLSEALRLRDEFLSIASHELKTPLTALKLQLQILERRSRPESHIAMTPEKIQEKLRPALRQIEALNYLIDNLLDVSRIRSGRFALTYEKVSLPSLLNMVLEDYHDQISAAGLSIKQKTVEDVTGVWDRARLQQVLNNLLSNAMKYAPNSELAISLSRKDERAIITVADNGPGIATERLPQIFEPFDRGGISHNLGGLGLGLFIVRQIVDAHKGDIKVDSEPGGGTRFEIGLPLTPTTH